MLLYLSRFKTCDLLQQIRSQEITSFETREVYCMKKPLPILKTHKEAEVFIEEADLTDYDLGALKQVRFEFQPKDKRVTMRISDNLFSAIKAKA